MAPPQLSRWRAIAGGAATLALLSLVLAGAGCAPGDDGGSGASAPERAMRLERAESLDVLRARNAEHVEEPAWARLYWARVLDRRPNDRAALWGFARAATRGAEAGLSEARGALERLIAQGEAADDARLLLARTLHLLGDSAAARVALHGMDGTEALGLVALSWLNSEPERGLEPARAALAASPSDPDLHLLAARLALRAGDPEGALGHAREALRLAPLRSSAAYLVARALAARGEAAEEALETAALLYGLENPGPDVEQALAALEKLPPDPRIHLRRVELLLASGRAGEARAALDRALPPAAASRLLRLAERAQRAGDLGLARRLIELALAHEPDSARACGMAAELAFAAGDLVAASGFAERLAELFPDAAAAAHVRGLLALTRGEEGAAELELERAVSLAPFIARYRVAWLEALWTAGRRQEALRGLEDAPAAAPELAAFRQRRRL